MSEMPRHDRERDVKLTALYRAAAQDEPPSALDGALRAAARRAVGARPRHAGLPFSRSWRVPLSIAAVILLSVSLVTLMHEEAPEVAQPPRAAPPPAVAERKPAAPVRAAAESAGAIPKTTSTPDAPRSNNLGRTPPQQKTPAGPDAGGREPAPASKNLATAGAEKYKEGSSTAAIGIRGSGGDALIAEQGASAKRAPSPLSQRPSPEAFPGTADKRDSKVAASVEEPGQAGKEEARRDITSASAAAPAAKPTVTLESGAAGAILAQADLSPAKWLERIEELRKQGRLEEAKASLAEFRKRYPDYPLPAPLKDGIKP